MKNKEKILIALVSFSFFLIVYLVIVSKKIEMPKEKIIKNEPAIEKVDLVALRSDYQETAKMVYAQLNSEDKLLASSTDEVNVDEKLLGIKNTMILMSVPEEYKIFHVSLILLIDKVLNDEFMMDGEFQDGLDVLGRENMWLN